jgi:hypothetical protein
LTDTFTGQKFAAPCVPVARAFTTAKFDLRDLITQIGNQLFHLFGIVAEIFRAGIYRRFQNRHRQLTPFVAGAVYARKRPRDEWRL